jgi:hypothetical protein
MSDASQTAMLRAAALVTLAIGGVLLLGTWDGLYEALDLPQGLPALSTQLGGAAMVATAYLLWAAASRPELAPTAAFSGAIALGGGALVIAAWLILQDPNDDLGIDTLGTVILIAVAAVFAVLALGLARVAVAARSSPG